VVFHLVPKLTLFPSSAWEHTFTKLRFAIHHGKQSFRKMRDQAELGHEEKTDAARRACGILQQI
jgi:hypothetical protein